MDRNIKSKLSDVYKKAVIYSLKKTIRYALVLTACTMFVGSWAVLMSFVILEYAEKIYSSTCANKEQNKKSFGWMVLFSICSSLFHYFIVAIILVAMYPKLNRVKPVVKVSLKCITGNMLITIIFIVTGVHSFVNSVGSYVILGHFFSFCVWMFVSLRVLDQLKSKNEQDKEDDEEEVEEVDEPELCDYCRSIVDV